MSSIQIRAARDAAAAEAMAAAAAEGAQVNAEELDVDMPEALPVNLPGRPSRFLCYMRLAHADQLPTGANRLAAPLPNHFDIQPLPLYDRLRQLGQERVDRVDQMPAARQHANVALNINNGHISQHEGNIARMVNADLARARPGARRYSPVGLFPLYLTRIVPLEPLLLPVVVPAAGAAVDPAARLMARLAPQSARRGGGRR